MAPGSIYEYEEVRDQAHHAYILPAVLRAFAAHPLLERRAFEIGCGSGYVANALSQRGFAVVGVDPSASGVALANANFPHLDLRSGNSEDDLAHNFGTFPFIYSIETVAHVMHPHLFAKRVYDLLDDGGVAAISAPFHGYFKNLAIALRGGWDFHFHTLESTKYLSFYSEHTFRELWARAGFRSIEIIRVGRTRVLAKAMIAVLRKS